MKSDRIATDGWLGAARLRRLSSALLSALLLLLVSCASGPAPGTSGTPARFITASDACFRYDGRFDFTEPKAPVVIWQASRVSFDFSGDTLGLWFSDVRGQCFFNVTVDDSSSVIGFLEGRPAAPAKFLGLGPGRHHAVLFKRSEANAGTVRFRGAELAPGATASKPAPTAYRLRMEFIGDSITAGACDEDGDTDQWDNRLTHNAAVSYAALTAAAFRADYRNIAVSGMGVAIGWVPQRAGEVWNRTYPTPDSPLADLTSWMPDMVFVNLGDNDETFTRDHDLPFPAEFTARYVALVRAIRAARPNARIVLLRGGMYSGVQSESLRRAWDAAVAQLEAEDPGVSHYMFQHWSMNHPRVADHQAMAEELVGWLREQGLGK